MDMTFRQNSDEEGVPGGGAVIYLFTDIQQ